MHLFRTSGDVCSGFYSQSRQPYSPIHKAAGSLVTGRSLQNRKMSMGNRRTERSPEVVLYGGRQSGGFVSSAVIWLRCMCYMFPENHLWCNIC